MDAAVFQDDGHVVDGPLYHRLAGLKERTGTVGEQILYARRDFGIDRTLYETVGLQAAQRSSQHLLRNVRQGSL